MRVVSADWLGTIDDYALIERQVPEAGAGEVLVRVGYCGIGHADALVALGRYQIKPPVPFTPGSEVGGRVAAVGAEVGDLAVGDRVMAAVRGGLAEFAVAPAASVHLLPESVDLDQAAALRTDYLTALHALEDRAAARPSETLLVLGAGGGVGLAAVGVGKQLGLRIVAAASTDAKRAAAAAQGADMTIDTKPEGWRERLKQACGDRGPDIVFDPVSGPLFEPAFRSLAWGGRHLVIGFTGGAIPALRANLPLMKGAALTGVDVRQFALFEPARAAAHIDRLLGWAADRRLAPTTGRVFDLADFAAAFEHVLSGKGIGKTLVAVAGADGTPVIKGWARSPRSRRRRRSASAPSR